MVFFELDTSRGNHEIDILIKLNPVDDNKLISNYIIKDVFLHPDHSFVLGDTSIIIDTFQIEQLKVITNDIKQFNWKQIERNILLSPGQKYRFSDFTEYIYL